MLNSQQKISEWEKAEIERSFQEAETKSISDLKISESIIECYLSAEENTAYPLEFMHFLLGDLSGKKVLDFGCGDGENSILIAKRGADLIGIDISTELLKLAKQRMKLHDFLEKSEFFTASAHSLPFENETFDVIFGKSILHHLDLPTTEKEIYRVLKKGGKAIFLEPVRNSKLIKFIRNLIPYQQKDVSPFERPLTDEELKNFSKRFSKFEGRKFSLPFVNLIKILPIDENWVHRSIKLDRKILKRFGLADNFATICVFTITK